MSGSGDYISREAFLAEKRHLYCENCARRKGMKNGKMKFIYEIGDAPCRACDIGDVLDDVEDFPAADAIEELSKPKWISVEEKRAEWPCICCDANGNMPFIPHGIVTITDAQGTWQLDAHLADPMLQRGKIKPVLGYGNRITHWMPLPEPPKEE